MSASSVVSSLAVVPIVREGYVGLLLAVEFAKHFRAMAHCANRELSIEGLLIKIARRGCVIDVKSILDPAVLGLSGPACCSPLVRHKMRAFLLRRMA